jgi:histidine kinase/histidine kinase/DNA gyrase B/HSP90-like ATPase
MSPRAASLRVLPDSWQKGEYRVVLVVSAVCCVVSIFMTLLNGSSISDNLVTSHMIGLSQLTLATLVRLFFRGRLPVLGIVFAIPAGFLLGSKLASLVGVPNDTALMLSDPAAMRGPILIALFVAVVVTAFFLYFSYTRGVREDLERERRRAAEALQGETAARLALLQAQIEPHFLFNTLANIHALIKQDPDAASRTIEELNAYLRASLRRSRQMTATVGEEVELVEALLALARARLGARLAFTVTVPPELRDTPLPPLLLQPLVENAIRHGIEPAIDGGKIAVEVRKTSDALELTVTDTGVGLSANSPEGVGLSNVRARLTSLFGDKGRLQLYANMPRGVIAKLMLP